MDGRVVVGVAVGVVALVAVAFVAGGFDPLLTTDGYDPSTPKEGSDGGALTNDTGTRTAFAYEHTTVTVVDDESGEELGSVRAAVADTYRKQYTGLSKTESLPPDQGMLFTYGSEGRHTFVMRDMDFGIDIVYVGANGTITRIYHAPEPPEGEDGEDHRYPGTGKYVLEVNYEWTTSHGVEEGDEVRIDGYET